MKAMKKTDVGRRVRAWVTNPDSNAKDPVLEITGTVCSVLSVQFTMDTPEGWHVFVFYSDKWHFDG